MARSNRNPDHDFSYQLLPWLVNGTLKDEDRQRVIDHMADCVSCQQELGVLDELNSVMVGEQITTPTPNLERIHGRLRNRFWVNPNWWYRPLLATAAVASIAFVLLAVQILTSPPQDQPFRTATGSQRVELGQIQVVFSPAFTAAEQQQLLQSLSLQVVAGPSPQGKFVLAPGPDTPQDFALRLQQSPGVAFASDPVTVE